MEVVNNDTTEKIETFEENPLGKTITLWNGREVFLLPLDKLSL